MSKQYKKEKLGFVGSSFSADGIFTIPHSPEQEQAQQKLIERLQPIFLQGIQQAINLYIDETIEINQGDIITYVTQYINNYFQTIGPSYVGGGGINILGDTISVRAGEGLETTDGDLNIELSGTSGLEINPANDAAGTLEVKDGDGIAIDSDGTKVDLADDITTIGEGCGLDFTSDDGDGKLQVAPEDFLYMGEEE